ncbi:MAG: DUF763 domain-containing protein [Actinomycetota bacterium]|jgi:hypothetical protein|nr:DUF763 domain-containing protein [Actinomycetota bacterium]
MRTGTFNLPLHGGKAPGWLFEKMKRLARQIVLVIIEENGTDELIERISDPYWFQAFGCILGFDWHSSGVTTTVCGALKEALRGISSYTGIYVAGGKGGTSRKTPSEIEAASEKEGNDFSRLVYASKIVAKVDSSALQDGYQLYHHTFIFSRDGKKWCVVQQGMNSDTRYARRYHWLSSRITDYVVEPHNAICCDTKNDVLNLVALDSSPARKVITEITHQKPEQLLRDMARICEHADNKMIMPRRHDINFSDIEKNRLAKIFQSTYEQKPPDFEKLISMPGVGPKTVRSLALISELIYSTPYSIKDPARFSFAHGGKDGIPYPVDKINYDKSIEVLSNALKESKIGRTEKMEAFKKLALFY